MKVPSKLLCTLAVTFAFLVPTFVLQAADPPLPGGRAMDLEVSDSYLFELDGETLSADVYYSRYEVAFFISAPELERPLLISPRGRSVQAVAASRMSRSRGLGARLGEGAVLEVLGQYREAPGAYVFELDGKTARLLRRPPAVGSHSAEDLGRRHRRYSRLAREHVPRRRVDREGLTGREDLLVRVYFGSWSPACERMVPKILRLEEELGGRVRFDYVGVSKPLSRDPAASEDGVYALPTAVVLRGGEEVGRLHGRPLDTPEDALYDLLAEAASR